MKRHVWFFFLLSLLFGMLEVWADANDPPLTLQDAIATALAQHPTLRVGEANVAAARYRVHQQAAGYLPRGGYTYSFTHQQRPVTAAVGGVRLDGEQQRTRSVAQVFDFHSTSLGFSQVLFDFGRTLDAIRAASASVEASMADVETTKQEVIFTTKQAYYGLLSSQHLLRVAEETVRQNQKHLEVAQARLEVGVAPRFDVTQAQVQVSNAQLNFVSAQNTVARGRETLRTAMGSTAPLAVTLVDALDRHEIKGSDEDLVQLAYTHRPELRSLRAQQKAATERASSLRKQHLPQLSSAAQYSWTGRGYPLQDGWNIGLTLSVPLFDNILTTAQVGEAQANLQGLVAQGDDLQQRIAFEVRDSVLELRRADESIRVGQATETQARENLALAEGRYQVGVGNIIEVTDAQASMTSARANVIQALYNFQTARARLEKAIGQSID